MKKKHPKALVTVSDMAYVTVHFLGDKNSREDQPDDMVQSAEEEESTDTSDLPFIANGDLHDIDQTLSNDDFLPV